MKSAARLIMPNAITRSELLKRRLDRFTRVLDGLEKGEVRALHRARVASRRLRELVPMLQLDHGLSKKLSRRLRRVTIRLGHVRELDVLLMMVDELHVSRRSHGTALGRVGMAVSKDRDRARRKLFARLPMTEMRRLSGKLSRTVSALQRLQTSSSKSAARAWKWSLDARIARRAARLSAAIQDAGALYLPERLHAVRIALKKLRYAAELSNEAAGRRGDADIRMLKRGQELLGRMHDLQVLIDQVRQLQASLAPPNVAVWRDLDALMEMLEDDCRRLHARYMRARDELAHIAVRLGSEHTPTRSHAARRAG